MAYKSEADQWRELFEQQKAIAITNAIKLADMYEWNSKLAEETLRIRETNRLLRHENAGLRSFVASVVWVAALITYWNIIT